jgi:type I restriction enzyme, S subunit
MTRGIPDPGDVLITTEAPLGNVACVPDFKVAFAQRLLTLQTKKDELDSKFLFWLLVSPESKLRIQKYSTGSTATGIKQSVFRKIPFLFPNLEEQRMIIPYLEEIDKNILIEKSNLDKCLNIQKGLMQDLLTGSVPVPENLLNA